MEFGEIMPKQSKRVLELKAKVKGNQRYSSLEAFSLVKELVIACFDESIDAVV